MSYLKIKRIHLWKLWEYVNKNKNDFLFLNIASQRMFKNFDEIIINDSDNESDNETMINN